MWNKFEDFMDSYVYLCDCGVRGWLAYSAITLGAFVLYLFGLLSEGSWAIASLVSIGLLIALWSRDYAMGYVPLWWLRLGNKAYRQ